MSDESVLVDVRNLSGRQVGIARLPWEAPVKALREQIKRWRRGLVEGAFEDPEMSLLAGICVLDDRQPLYNYWTFSEPLLVTLVTGESAEIMVQYGQENIAMSVSSWTTAGLVKDQVCEDFGLDTASAVLSLVLPLEVRPLVHYLALFFGVLNALSGLQPSLLGPRRELSKLLGFGRQGDVKSGGFLNAAGFYLVLAYQTLRAVMPELALFDPIVGFITMTLVCHQAYILNRWVASGQMHRVDAFLVPGIFNLPVSLHLAGGSSQALRAEALAQ
ncbi:Uncharacterized protein SCF082_LOCUS35921 [Durusdinium trenchii]|uniref:Uncharacterized protein n=1 Tax=Durusdinium trenchii TaxID=1381693 RepID=A0ABP0PBA1_9DINO